MKPVPIGQFIDTPSYEELQQEIASLRLTDEEREAIAYAELTLRCETHPVCERHTATLRSLLKRLEVRS